MKLNNCVNCGKETSNPKFCDRSCAAQTNNVLMPKRKSENSNLKRVNKPRPKTNNCINCGEPTSNPKYCSKSCSAIVSNTSNPKRTTKRKCLDCGGPVANYRKSRCDEHTELYKQEKYKILTIGEYRSRVSVAGKHPSWVHSHVRGFARSWLKHLTKQSCRHCNYNKHVELAHIKGVSSFDDSALLSEVNSEENVIPLCPNCHWEFDNLPRK